jgi:hypothetical protein
VNVGTIFQYQIINWAIPVIIRTPPCSGTLEFPEERCINFKFPGEGVHEPWNFQGRGWINPGISRAGGIQDLEFQGEEYFSHGIPRGRGKFHGMEMPWEDIC